MKNIFLIGDSIRYGATYACSPGYGGYVKEMLAGKAHVYAPNENCRFAAYTLRYLYDWAKAVDRESIDVVHWNNGLWEVLRIMGEEPHTPIDLYVYYLRRVHSMIKKLFPNAKIIFALSTSVIEDMSSPEFTRRNADIEAYNAAATELMCELGVEVNDLYSISLTLGRDRHVDFVHFDDEGSKILGDAVIAKIMA